MTTVGISVTAPDGRKLRHQVQGEPVGDWLAVTPELSGDPERVELSGRWTVTHRPSGMNAAASSAWASVDAARLYAREADALGAKVWGRADLRDGWFVSREGAAARDALFAALMDADQVDVAPVVPIGHQSEPAQPAVEAA